MLIQNTPHPHLPDVLLAIIFEYLNRDEQFLFAALSNANCKALINSLRNLKKPYENFKVTLGQDCVCVQHEHKLYARGLNKYGELGLGNTNEYTEFTHIILPDHIEEKNI